VLEKKEGKDTGKTPCFKPPAAELGRPVIAQTGSPAQKAQKEKKKRLRKKGKKAGRKGKREAYRGSNKGDLLQG